MISLLSTVTIGGTNKMKKKNVKRENQTMSHKKKKKKTEKKKRKRKEGCCLSCSGSMLRGKMREKTECDNEKNRRMFTIYIKMKFNIILSSFVDYHTSIFTIIRFRCMKKK